MSKRIKKALEILRGLTLLGVNISGVLFFALSQIEDGVAINRMETASDVDPVQVLPPANLMWTAAHVSLFMVLVADVLAAVFIVNLVKSRYRSCPKVGEPLLESFYGTDPDIHSSGIQWNMHSPSSSLD